MQNLIVTASIMYCAGWQFGFEAAFGWLWCWSSAMHPTYHANSVIFPLAQCRAGSRVARSRSTKGTLKSKLSPCIWTSNVFLLRNNADRFHSTEGERGEGDRSPKVNLADSGDIDDRSRERNAARPPQWQQWYRSFGWFFPACIRSHRDPNVLPVQVKALTFNSRAIGKVIGQQSTFSYRQRRVAIFILAIFNITCSIGALSQCRYLLNMARKTDMIYLCRA